METTGDKRKLFHLLYKANMPEGTANEMIWDSILVKAIKDRPVF